MATVTQLRPVEISPEEWEVRCDLAALYRAFVRYGWTDLIYTHISARLPGEPTQYLINPYGLMFEEITASNLIVMDFDGNKVRGDWPVNEAGHAIHHAVLKARPDVDWVLHTHSRAGMAVACMKCGVLPITQQAMFYHGQIAYHPWDVQTSGQEECDRLAADLGDKNFLMLRNHGLLTVGPTVADAFLGMYAFESTCAIQVSAQAGGELVRVNPKIMETMPQVIKMVTASQGANIAWPALLRKLDRLDASYKL